MKDHPVRNGGSAMPGETRLAGFRVGVTGHRPNKLGQDGRIRDSLGLVFRMLDSSLGRLEPERAQAVGRAADRIVLSALAEGADRLAVEAAPPGWRLEALLPMPRAEYETDFLRPGERTSPSRDAFRAALAKADRVTELPFGATQDRDTHYAALGAALVRRIDILLAVWDGRAAEGPGGTGNVVAEAAGLGVGVIHVDPADPARIRLISGFRQGDVATPPSTILDTEALDTCLAIALARRRGSVAETSPLLTC